MRATRAAIAIFGFADETRENARAGFVCTAIAAGGPVDRLFDALSDREERDLIALAELELRLEWHRRLRRFMLAGAVVASVACWADARFAVAALACAPPLFAFFALSATSLYCWERRLDGQRRRLLTRLPEQMQ